MRWIEMPEMEYRASRLCRVLGNPKTYAILKTLLKVKFATPTQLAKVLRRHRTTISIHLRNLRNLDLVSYQRLGRESVYWVKSIKLQGIFKSLEDYVRFLRTVR